MDDLLRQKLYTEIGSRAKSARERAGLTQEKLAKRVDISRASIVNIEKGRQHAPLHVLWQIADALDVDVRQFIPSPAEVQSDMHQQVDDRYGDDAEVAQSLKRFIDEAPSDN